MSSTVLTTEKSIHLPTTTPSTTLTTGESSNDVATSSPTTLATDSTSSPKTWFPTESAAVGSGDDVIITVSFRNDERCGGSFLAPNGGVARCDPSSANPCCSSLNWCGGTVAHCECEGCINYSENYPLRLVDGNTTAGRVEIFISGQWGTICDDLWDKIDADVTCRQLGFTRAVRALRAAFFGQGVGPIHMNDLRCTGRETRLIDCVHTGTLDHDCTHSEDAGVVCSNSTTGISATQIETGMTMSNPEVMIGPVTHFTPTTAESGDDDQSGSSVALIGVGAGWALLVSLIIVIIVICLRLRKRRERSTGWFRSQHTNIAFVRSNSYRSEPTLLVEEAFLAVEITDRDNILIGGLLGSGQYGEVFKGGAKLKGRDSWRDVAIKKPKDRIDGEIINGFKDEIRLMLELGKHPNLISVLGCCTTCEPYYLLTDFMEYGDLRSFLRKAANETSWAEDPLYKISVFNQLQIARQISDGMTFVSHTRFFHGDLAARNILVGENLRVRITDFGLTNDLYQKEYTRLQSGIKRPYKWYSPESIEHLFCTLKTDIWSFGVLMWEVVTFGQQVPYHGMSIQEVLYRLKAGYRMTCPRKTPQFMNDLIQSCWQFEPADRPDFPDLFEAISFLLERGSLDANYIEATHSEEDDSEGYGEPVKGGGTLIHMLNLDVYEPSEIDVPEESAFLGGKATGMNIPNPLYRSKGPVEEREGSDLSRPSPSHYSMQMDTP